MPPVWSGSFGPDCTIPIIFFFQGIEIKQKHIKVIILLYYLKITNFHNFNHYVLSSWCVSTCHCVLEYQIYNIQHYLGFKSKQKENKMAVEALNK
ncbi:unnamed protein product [Plutella xylostella]|uniref:(diamondback moth) hypothetical protein n=1 Tax=Plutella xylostella TaxID=51655 RepID=A0A8S4FCZ6_PLUXY|nr:unnamed protein product [Plutella xylostella]